MSKDIYNNHSPAISLAPAARTATVNGTAVDLQGFEGAMVQITTGVMTDGTHTIDIKESDDNATFTSVAAADLQGTVPALISTDDNIVKKVGYLGTKRYLRVDVTCAGTTTGGIYAATVLRGFARHKPVS